MKRFLAILLTFVCVLSLAACDLDPSTNTPNKDNEVVNGNGTGSNGSNSSNGSSQGGITPGEDTIVNEDGTLIIPQPESGTVCTVDASLWNTLLSADAIRAAVKDNSITTITSSANKEEYQLFYCAGGRYGSILHGNMHSETICAEQDGKVYVYSRSSSEGSWSRSVSGGSYDEYITNHYIVGVMQYFSTLTSAYDKAEYLEADRIYIIKDHVVANFDEETLTGTVKIQFAGEKLYSITLQITTDKETATLSTLFGSAPTPELPTDYTEGNSGGLSTSDPTHKDDHAEPPEATCDENRWQRLFGERLIHYLTEHGANIKLSNGRQEYAYLSDGHWLQIVISDGNSYEELLLNHGERYQRDSKDGQWLYYQFATDYETVLSDKTAVLFQLLNPLADLYDQTSFEDSTKCFSLKNVSINHDTFGTATADYDIIIQGGMIEQISATVRSANGTWTLTFRHDKIEMIEAPTDYTAVDNRRPGK